MSIQDSSVVAFDTAKAQAKPERLPRKYVDLSTDVNAPESPAIPALEYAADLADCAEARESMRWLLRALNQAATSTTPLLRDLGALDQRNRELVDRILGEGEVSVICDGKVHARSRESTLSGVWQTAYLDEHDQIRGDLLEVGTMSHVAGFKDGCDRMIDTSLAGVEKGFTRASPILTELRSRSAAYRPGQDSHVINLTMLSLSDEEIAFIDGRLGRGPVSVHSRAFGKCQILSTQVANVWWVRYYNASGTLILNTLEVVDIPLVTCATPQDLVESHQRVARTLVANWTDG